MKVRKGTLKNYNGLKQLKISKIMKRINYVLIAAMVVILIIGFISLKGSRDLKVERKFLREKIISLETENHVLELTNNELSHGVNKYKDSIRWSSTRIDALERARRRVVVRTVTVKEVAKMDTVAIASEINRGHRCCAELVLADSLIVELKSRSMLQDSVINDQEQIIANLRRQVENANEMLQHSQAVTQTYRRQVRRLKVQRIGLLTGNGVAVAVIVALLL